MTQPLLSISDLPEMVRCFAQNLSETTVKELEGFLQSDELRYIPVKAMRVAVSQENAEWAVRIYLNQQDKIDRKPWNFPRLDDENVRGSLISLSSLTRNR